MRIAFVSLMTGSPWAASEILWAQAAQFALQQGHEVLISTYDWPDRPPMLQELEQRGARLNLRPLSRWNRRSSLITLLQNTYGTLQRFKPDIICVNQGGTYDIARSGSNAVLRRTLYKLHVPYVLLCHCEQPPPPRRNLDKARQVFARAAIIGMVSDRLRAISQSHLRMAITNVRIFHNPVNLRRIEYVPWPGEGETVRFAFVGRLEPVKNLGSLLSAFAEEKWHSRSWTLTVYGSGPDRNMLEQLVKQLSLEQRVQFAGYVNDLAAVWANHHVLLMPSRFEGVPLAMIEAMLCGRPVLATNVGGIADWLEEGRNGFLTPAPTPEAIGTALERLWQRRDELEQFGRCAHEMTMAKRDADPPRTLLNWMHEAARAPHRHQSTSRESCVSRDDPVDVAHSPPIVPITGDVPRPILSVVIPTYEPEELLVDTLRSVLAQDPGPAVMQIAIVDDGSMTRKPASMLTGIAPPGRIEFYDHADNLGLAGNWNRAISKARGLFVHVLHQDDTVGEGFYTKLLAGLNSSTRVGMAFCRHAFIDDEDRIEGVSHRERRQAGVLPGWLDRICTAQRIQCPAAIVRREVYETLGGFRSDLHYALDWEMWARIASRYDVWYEPEVLAYYRRHRNTETARLEAVGRTGEDTIAAIEILATHVPPAHRGRIKRRAYRRLARSHLRRAARLLDAGLPHLAARYIDSVRSALDHLPPDLGTYWNQGKMRRLAARATRTPSTLHPMPTGQGDTD